MVVFAMKIVGIIIALVVVNIGVIVVAVVLVVAYYPVVPAVVGTTRNSDMTGFEAVVVRGAELFLSYFFCISHLL